MLARLVGVLAALSVMRGAPRLWHAAAQPRATPCTVGAKLEVQSGGSWYKATVKRGPDAEGRCFVGYDAFRSTWDEWVGADRMRARGQDDAAAASVANTPVAWTEFPASGVYGCYEARTTYGAPGCVRTAVGCIGMQVELRPVMMFGLLDRTTYSDYDGRTGHYTYDGGTGVLTMTDGSRRGWRYKRTAATAFQALDRNGATTAYSCPLEKGKNPRRHPW